MLLELPELEQLDCAPPELDGELAHEPVINDSALGVEDVLGLLVGIIVAKERRHAN